SGPRGPGVPIPAKTFRPLPLGDHMFAAAISSCNYQADFLFLIVVLKKCDLLSIVRRRLATEVKVDAHRRRTHPEHRDLAQFRPLSAVDITVVNVVTVRRECDPQV